jgi:hypothetical protein
MRNFRAIGPIPSFVTALAPAQLADRAAKLRLVSRLAESLDGWCGGARDAALRRIGSKLPSATAEAYNFNEVITMSTNVSATDGERDSLVQTHPQIYHYTTEAGLRGIVESNSFRATYFRDMNDANEIHELRMPLIKEFTRRVTPFFKELYQKGTRATKLASASAEAEYSAHSWADKLYSTVFQERASDCYISSFCSHANDQDYERNHGLLSQWRGYGKDGGYCLVLDTAALSKFSEQEPRSYIYPYADLCVVHHSFESAQAVAPFSELLNRLEVGLCPA